MKIKMLSTMIDEEFDIEVWHEGDEYTVTDQCDDYYIIKEIMGQPYGVNKDCCGQMFVEVK